jgi:hypothetical protein
MKKGLIILIFLSSFTLVAKDLTSRLGVGYNAQITNAESAVSAKYAISTDYAFSGFLGFNAGGDNNNSSFVLGGKIYRNAYQEENANFYIGGGLGISSIETSASNTDTGFDLMGFLGTEFFFLGLQNLGFTFESGVTLTSRGSGVSFKTNSGSFITTGIHYYF